MDIFNFYAGSLESGVQTQDVAPLFESWITGEDPNELCQIANELNSNERLISENCLYSECLAHVASLQENTAVAEQLNEAAIKDYYDKFIAALKNAWAKVKAFFANLTKAIMVKMGPVTKAFANIDKYLNKDLSDFTYTAYDWQSGKIAVTKLTKGAASHIEACNSRIAQTVSEVKAGTKPELTQRDKNAQLRNVNGILIGAPAQENTPEEAIIKIRKMYGVEGAKQEFKGLAKKDEMITFVKSFDKNSVLKELKKAADENYAKAIKAAQSAKKDVSDLRNKDNKEVVNAGIACIKNDLSLLNAGLTAFNRFMGTCIALEREKFSSYRAILSAAIKHTPKKESK